MHGDDRLGEEIVELERLDQVAVPDQAAVGDVDVGHPLVDLVDLGDALGERAVGAEHRAIGLHHALHVEPDLGGRAAALGMAELVEPAERKLGGVLRQLVLDARRA